MAMFKRGHAAVIETGLTPDHWVNAVYETACADGKCRMKTAKAVIAKYDPRKYLLSHCFPAGHAILMADGTEKPIEKISVGDQIITHKGNVRAVTRVMTREVNEDLTVIKSACLPEISCTGEHPFYVLPRSSVWCRIFPFYAKSESVKCTFGGKQKCRKYGCSTNGANPDWIIAKNVKVGDRTYTPTLHAINISEDLNPNRMRLLGYYVAEGRVDNDQNRHLPYSIRFSIHQDELSTIGAEIKKLMNLEFGIETSSVIRNQKNNSKGLTIAFSSFEYAPWFLKHAGCGSKVKKLSLSVMHAPYHWQREFIGAWMNGDGSYDHSKKYSPKGFRLATVSKDLASQAVVLLDRLEIHSILYRVMPSKKQRKDGPYARIKPFDGWHVCVSNSYAVKLIPVVGASIQPNKAKALSTKKRYRYAASTISEVEAVTTKHFLGTVYNLSVEEDESYIVNRQAVHNCTIIAAVDTDIAPVSESQFKDYLIKPEYSKFVNNNGDAWTKTLLAACYKTFIGANNYLEHVQIAELSKGKVIDAVLREIPIAKTATGQDLSTYYVDILVATDRKHADLVRKIEANELTTLSMGCVIAYSICTKCGRVAKDETEACQHVRYEKNNTFHDDQGVLRRVAELCGHSSDPESVKFVDASWVRTPAFTGAVKRNTVNPPADVMAKLEHAMSIEGYQKKDCDFLKAAGFPVVIAQDPPAEEAPAEEPPVEEAPADQAPEEAPADQAPEEAPVDQMPAEEAPAGDPGAVDPTIEEPPPVPEESAVQKLKKDIKQKLLQQVGDEVLQEFSGDTGLPPSATTTLDETFIKPASVIKQAYRVWDQRLRQASPKLTKENFAKLRLGTFALITSRDPSSLAGYSKRDFIAVLAFLDKFTPSPLPADTRSIVAKFGGTSGNGPTEVSKSLVSELGRKMTLSEGKKAYIWLKLLDLQGTLL